jgi:hypothetical protein
MSRVFMVGLASLLLSIREFTESPTVPERG